MSARLLFIFLLNLTVFGFTTGYAWAETRLKPFILAETINSGSLKSLTLDSLTKVTRNKLRKHGFQVIGEFRPYADTHVLIITSKELRKQAARSEFGGYGAVQRVAISKTPANFQISYTNPSYMAQAYRMKSDLNHITNKLATALGRKTDFGSKKGLSIKELRKYQYEVLMPYFTDYMQLAEYPDHQKAIDYIERSLKKSTAGARKVYRVDIPGKQETIIGVQLKGNNKDDCSADHYIMSRVDFGQLKSAAHLPYEIMISNGNVYALFAEFRIAISFPDLNMVGKQSFATIICAPQAIETTLVKVAGGTIDW